MEEREIILVPYKRVSTKKQGKSGLGLEAQEQALQDYAKSIDAVFSGEFTEIEKGGNCRRPELRKAMEHAKRIGGKLCIAKLDRLARNVHLVSGLMESGVPFVCCDMPNVTPFMLHIYAAVAEEESKKTRERTKAAFAAKKARGDLMGTHRPGHQIPREKCSEGGAASAILKKEEFCEAYMTVFPIVKFLREQNKSLREIAETLNSRGIKTRNGYLFQKQQVKQILDNFRAVAGLA